MRSKNGFRHGAGLEQAETKQNGVTHNAPNGVDGILGNRYRLYQHGVNCHADEDEKALKTQRKQAFQVVLPHVRLLVVAESRQAFCQCHNCFFKGVIKSVYCKYQCSEVLLFGLIGVAHMASDFLFIHCVIFPAINEILSSQFLVNTPFAHPAG